MGRRERGGERRRMIWDEMSRLAGWVKPGVFFFCVCLFRVIDKPSHSLLFFFSQRETRRKCLPYNVVLNTLLPR